jgi:transposase
VAQWNPDVYKERNLRELVFQKGLGLRWIQCCCWRTGRFEFTFTPKHGSWLNLIEGFFSKFARSVLRHIRVGSKQELKERIMAGIEDINRYPVIHTWSYKLVEAA